MTAPAAPSDATLLSTAGALVITVAAGYAAVDALPAAAPAVLAAHVDDAVVALRRARADLGEATRAAGGVPATSPEPTRAAVLSAALPTVRTPGDVVAVCSDLEDVLTQTLAAAAARAAVPAVRTLCAGLATEAAARTGRLLILASLLVTGRPDPLAAPLPPAALPPPAGAVATPDARLSVERALPAGPS